MNILKAQEIPSFEEFAKEWNEYKGKVFSGKNDTERENCDNSHDTHS